MQTTSARNTSVSCDDIVATVVARGHVLLPADLAPGLLDAVARRLAALRTRVLRPTTLGTLTLAGLLAEVVKHPDPTPLAGPDLERGFDLLTDPGPRHDRPGYDRIVLLLDRADALDPAALRYLQLTTRDAPLQLVFSAGAAFRALLAWEEFGHLRRGFSELVSPPSLPDTAPPTQPAVQVVEPAPVATIEQPPPEDRLALHDRPARRRTHPGRWLLAGIGTAASVAGIVWLTQPGQIAAYIADARLLLLPPAWTAPQR